MTQHGASRRPSPLERTPPPPRWVDVPLSWLARAWSSIDLYLFVVWCCLTTGFVASVFVTAMLGQTGGEWSGPLDDTFIHFDYARSAARGRPFEWASGNGYSSGATSVLYPFVLAIGWRVGFRELSLMKWAVGVAVVSTIIYFVAGARLLRLRNPASIGSDASLPLLGRWAKYLVAPATLSLGALGWSLFSGMENAFHLGVWGLAALAWARLSERCGHGASAAWRAAAWLGIANAALVLTRPESVVCVAAFAVSAAVSSARLLPASSQRPRVLGPSVVVLGLAAGLPVLALASQATANRIFTGEWAAAGSIAKLLPYDPYLSFGAMASEYGKLLKYLVTRLFHYHLSDKLPYGYIALALALVPVATRATRHVALTLWAQILGWFLLVALNTQARWQNERYIMSAAAWLLLLAVMGIGALASRFGNTVRERAQWGARLAVVGIAITLYWHHQRPRFRDQVWFYARASRNIREQQLEAGFRLAKLDPKPRRVLVGDAGAIIYAADVPGLDLIGLGGYRDYPFAAATRAGPGAGLELIERIPPKQRPDYLALYPEWWGELPAVFGRKHDSVAITGNVICGGTTKVLYTADWSSLDRDGRPSGDHSVIDELDVADLISERRHDHRLVNGHVVWRALPRADNKSRDVFDAGRVVDAGTTQTFQVDLPTDGGHLIIRTATTTHDTIEVAINGAHIGVIETYPDAGWSEPSLPLPTGLPKLGRVTLKSRATWVNYHVWITK